MDSSAMANEASTASDAVVASDLECIRELLASGMPLNRVTQLFGGRVAEKEVRNMARDVISERPTSALSMRLLESTLAVKDDNFVAAYVSSLVSEAPEDLLDPVFFKLMVDPVVLSSGYVVDRSTAVDEAGQLKFRTCPFSRASLKNDVYPLIEKKKKLHEFKETRLQTMISTATALLADHKFSHFDHLIAAAEQFLDELGDTTYIHHARKLAELRLSAASGSHRDVQAEELAKIVVRLYRTLRENGADIFQQQIKRLEANARNAIAMRQLSDAERWCQACAKVRSACGVQLPVPQLRLELAKAQGLDLRELQLAVYREIRRNPEAVQKFLEEEGLGPEDLRDVRPFFLSAAVIRDASPTDSWLSSTQSLPLEGPVAKIEVTVQLFTDQGWGNYKGNLALALYDAAGVVVTRCNLFGTYRDPNYAYPDSPSRTLEQHEEIVSQARENCTYRLEYTVGGGGGHAVHVRGWTCKIFPQGYTTEVVEWGDLQVEGAGDGRANGRYVPADSLPDDAGWTPAGLIWKSEVHPWLYITFSYGGWWIGSYKNQVLDLYTTNGGDANVAPVTQGSRDRTLTWGWSNPSGYTCTGGGGQRPFPQVRLATNSLATD